MSNILASFADSGTDEMYQYRDCGLDNVWLSGGFERSDSPYGEVVFVRDMDGLHQCIAQCLVSKAGPLSGPEFRFLRTELDLSQSAMGLLCGRDERTVRSWESSEEGICEPANTIVRFVYTQRHEPAARFEAVSKAIHALQLADKRIFELKLQATASGWKPLDGAPITSCA
jgi:DNA-binding transcriptional regulator YiaG